MTDETATPAQEGSPEQTEHPRKQAGREPDDGERMGRLLALRRLARARGGASAAAALLCVIVGVAGSLLAAHLLASSDARKAKARFRTSSAEIAARLSSAIQREEDLTVAASTFFAGNPRPSPAEFGAWAGWARTLRRYPELQRLSFLSLVPASQLKSFAARVAGQTQSSQEATTASSAAQPLAAAAQIIPAGARSPYCLASAELVRAPAARAPAGLDYCARGQSLFAARDSGLAISRPLARRAGVLEVQTPVYRGVATPSTRAARQGAFVGWLREVLRPGVLARRALAGHAGYAAQLRFGSGAAALAASGSPPPGAQTAVSRLRNGWTLQSFGPASGVALLADGRAAWALVAGVLLSLLVGLAILALGARRREPRPPAASNAPQPPVESLYDALTGLPNRALMLDRAGRMLARAGRQSGILAGALLIDIDWFKDVNDKLGREAGDQLLKIVAQRLEGAMRTQDTVSRLGADKFVVLVESAARGVRMDALAQRVIETLHRPVDLDDFGPSFFMTASIGVAFGRYETAEDLLRDAELALSSAKAAGKDRYTLFNANMRSVIEGRGVLEADLNSALQDGQLFQLYEPIYDLGTRRVAGVEALLRWRHPKRGVLAPADFVPLAEESGLIVPIERWALEEACNRAAAWEVQGQRIGVCVKVADAQLHRDGFLTDLRRALQQSGVQPGLLTLEVAEAAVMRDVALAATRLREIKQLGVRVAIDDFGGSGYAYHSDLRKLPLDCLRVDRSSLAAPDDEDYRNWLLEAILIVGRDLSLAVVAKGVSSQEQVSALQAMGCTMVQGLFVGEPISAEAVIGLFGSELPMTPLQPTAMSPQAPVALIAPVDPSPGEPRS